MARLSRGDFQGRFNHSLIILQFRETVHCMKTTITGKNQITIPAALVDRMDLKPGTRIEWLPGAELDEFVCRVVPDPTRLAAELRGAGRAYLKPAAIHPIDALVAEREEDERQRGGNL